VTRVTPVIIAAAALLLVLDIIGAIARQPLGFPYSSLGAVSLVTYFTVGLMGTWRAHFRHGVIAAVIVGFLDATLGPLAAWMIGPGPVGQTITRAQNLRLRDHGGDTHRGRNRAPWGAGSWLERRRGLRGSQVVPH
jgi:hypothetical protein